MSAPRKPGPKPNSSTTRERILDAAQALIASGGLEAVRLQDIADEVGIRSPSVFGHFKGLKALTEAVFVRMLEGMESTLNVSSELEPDQALAQALHQMVNFLASNPANTRLLLQQLGSQGRAMEAFEEGAGLMASIENTVGSIYVRGIEQGKFVEMPPSRWIAAVIGYILTALAWHDFNDWQQPGWEERVQIIEKDALRIMRAMLTP